MQNKVLGGRYRIQDRIGEGGMAFVYLALDEKLGRRVAIKVLHEHMEQNQDIRKRFQMEAQAISSLDHPNIVKIYDFSGDDNDRLWIVTEVIRGKNLAQLVQKQPGSSLHPVIAACIVREICKALQKAHTTGIVHRDIKPENVMITNEGRVKLMDFGIAKDMQKSNLTLTGTFMGSPSYMSPEQIRGKDVDPRSDIYSLGVLFYEIVTGKLPFTGQTTHDVVMRIMEGEFTYPRFLVPALAPEIDTMVVRAMQKEVSRRFQSIAEFGDAIDNFLVSYGHVESHVELERYFKDRKGYEEKLRKSPALGAPNQTNSSARSGIIGTVGTVNPGVPARPQGLHAATTRDRASQVPAAQHHTGVSASTAHIPVMRNSQIVRQSAVPDQSAGHAIPVTRTVEAATEYQRHHDRVDQPSRRKNTRTLPPRTIPHAKPRFANASTAREQRAPAWDVQAKFANLRQKPRLPRRSVVHVRPVAADVVFEQPSAMQYLLGFVLVGVVVILTLWGFWELQGRMSDDNLKAPRNVERAYRQEKSKKTNTQISASKPSPVVDRPQPKAVDKNTERPLQKSTEKSAEKIPEKGRDRSIVSEDGRSEPVVVRTTKPGTSQVRPNVHLPATNPKAHTSKVATTTANQRSEPGPAATSKPVPASTTPTDGQLSHVGKAGLFVSSQPAAEVWINGKRMGTTVDETSGSGWISLSAGEHRLELRRSGYETWVESLHLEDGEKKKMSTISLAKRHGGAEQGASYALTIAARPAGPNLSANVTLKHQETGKTETFVLTEESKTLELSAGRWHIRVERQGVIKERYVNLGGNNRSLTFSAEFKETAE